MLDRGEFDSRLWALPQALWLLGATWCLTHFLDRFTVALAKYQSSSAFSLTRNLIT
jgi:hypothetical protein